MEIVNFTGEMHEEVCRWWRHYDWGEIPLSLLPARGFVVKDNDLLVCACWIYEDKTSAFGMLEWVVANPDINSIKSVKGLHLLIDTASKYASQHGLILHTTVRVKGLIKLYEKYGFITADEEMTNMARF